MVTPESPLPTLPELPPVSGYDKRVEGHYSAAAMREYGRTCALAALEARPARQAGARKTWWTHVDPNDTLDDAEDEIASMREDWQNVGEALGFTDFVDPEVIIAKIRELSAPTPPTASGSEGAAKFDGEVGFHVIGETPGGLFRREHRFTEHGANTLAAQWKLEFASKIKIYIRPLYAHPAEPGRVDEAMVERALESCYGDGWKYAMTADAVQFYTDKMRMALTAALSTPSPRKEGET